jgi:hypothetical protein
MDNELLARGYVRLTFSGGNPPMKIVGTYSCAATKWERSRASHPRMAKKCLKIIVGLSFTCRGWTTKSRDVRYLIGWDKVSGRDAAQRARRQPWIWRVGGLYKVKGEQELGRGNRS